MFDLQEGGGKACTRVVAHYVAGADLEYLVSTQNYLVKAVCSHASLVIANKIKTSSRFSLERPECALLQPPSRTPLTTTSEKRAETHFHLREHPITTMPGPPDIHQRD